MKKFINLSGLFSYCAVSGAGKSYLSGAAFFVLLLGGFFFNLPFTHAADSLSVSHAGLDRTSMAKYQLPKNMTGDSEDVIRQAIVEDIIRQVVDRNGGQPSEGELVDRSTSVDDDVAGAKDVAGAEKSDEAGEGEASEFGKVAVEPEQYSMIEEQYRQGYGSLLSTDLHQFGYEVFRTAATRSSRLGVPGEDYLVGPGDKLRIRIWGAEVDAEFVGAVARDGSINVPRIGIVPVAGVRFGALESVIRKEAEKYIQGININVSLAELRSLEVYVVGAVNSPGLHLLPAFSSVLGGLLSADGVRKTGSLRGIELYRDGRLLKKIDLYDLLLKGRSEIDLLLADRDVVFVPRIGQTVAVAGAVGEAAIYELRNEKTVGELFDLAGGILPQGSTGRMYLRRFMDNQEFVVQDITTSDANAEQWQGLEAQNGDLLELRFLSPAWPQVVRLEGHVWQPDVFRYQEGLDLADVLVSTDLLKPDSVMDYALLYRYDPETTRFQVKRFPLARVLAHQYNAPLQPYDRIIILSREEVGMSEEFSVHGAVWSGGTFPYRPGTTLADALALAGGQKFGARRHRIELSRQEIVDDQVATRQIILDMDKDGDFFLQPYDDLFIPQVKDATLQKKITVTGQVMFPGTYVIQPGEHVSDVVRRAGGFLPNAYYYGAEYTSKKAREIQQQSIDRLVQELDIRAHQVSIEQAQTAVDAENVAAVKATESSVSALLNKIKAVRAKGRVAIKLSDLESFSGSKYDFTVEDGDTLHVPERPNFVATVGSVYSPSAYMFEAGKNLGYYLDKSGGPTKMADDDHVYLLKASGEVVAKAKVDGIFSSFDAIEVRAGDTIVVPEDLERIPYLRLVKDISDIVFKIATTAGVAVAVL